MRDWTVTDLKDQACLKSAKRADDTGGTWLPEDGRYARARRLAKKGLLRKAGIAAMPPHVSYVLTDKGFEELQVAETLSQQLGNKE